MPFFRGQPAADGLLCKAGRRKRLVPACRWCCIADGRTEWNLNLSRASGARQGPCSRFPTTVGRGLRSGTRPGSAVIRSVDSTSESTTAKSVWGETSPNPTNSAPSERCGWMPLHDLVGRHLRNPGTEAAARFGFDRDAAFGFPSGAFSGRNRSFHRLII